MQGVELIFRFTLSLLVSAVKLMLISTSIVSAILPHSSTTAFQRSGKLIIFTKLGIFLSIFWSVNTYRLPSLSLDCRDPCHKLTKIVRTLILADILLRNSHMSGQLLQALLLVHYLNLREPINNKDLL